MIRFSAFLVVVAVGLLVAGVVTSKLLLVYLAIGVSGVALLALGVGAAVKWRELFAKPQAAAAAAEAGVREPVSVPAPQAPAPQAPAPQVQLEHQGYPWPATAPGGPARQPAAASEAALWESAVPPTGMFPAVRPAEQAPGAGERRDDSIPASATPSAASPAPPAKAPVPAEAPAPAKAPVPAEASAVAQEQATAATPSTAQDQPGATDQQLSEVEPSGQDLQPAADSRPVTDLQAGKSRPATQQPAEDTAKPARDTAQTAPDTAQPAAAPIPASPEPAAPAVAVGTAPATAAAPAAANADPETPSSPETSKNSQTIVTVVPGVPRYHNASCILIRFMGEGDLETMTLAAAREAGCTPCRACLPDQPDKQPDLSLHLLRRAEARTSRRDCDRHARTRPGRVRLAGSRWPGPRERSARRARSAPRPARGRPSPSAARSGR